MHDLAALRRDSILHNLHIIVHLSYLPLDALHSRTFPLRTPGILIHVAILISPQCFFQIADGGLHLFNLPLNGLLFLQSEVDALARSEREWYIEISLDIEECIPLIR